MLWNFAMHVLMGFFGPHFFTYTPEGIGMALLVVCLTQGVDQARIKKEKYREAEELPESERLAATKELDANIKSILIKTFIQNVLMFTALVLITADVARMYG
ncbi:MAG: hypothetical protein L3J26_12065 [Candidatus Polarisedimenticolaceae bacterium]|nr:hypothetical protein [Candidatus Polarisedimenticolaceae bacterium]